MTRARVETAAPDAAESPVADAPPEPAADAVESPEPEPDRRTGDIERRRVVIDVPATTANLGAGYDALALALDLVNRVEVEVTDSAGYKLRIEGEGAGDLPEDRHNRFVVAFETGLRWALGSVPEAVGWSIRMENRIPLGRGLGSSAAATVAGLVAADTLAGGRLEQAQILRLAAEIEGHPDNAAAALLGGFVVVAIADGGRPETIRFDPPRRLRTVLFVPSLPMATSTMRRALPHQVPHKDAAFNVGRAALAVAAMTSGRIDLLRLATEDRLHQPYRSELYAALPDLIAAAREAGALGACLSGAGSTIIAFGDSARGVQAIESAFASAAAAAGLHGSVMTVSPRSLGAVVLETR